MRFSLRGIALDLRCLSPSLVRRGKASISRLTHVQCQSPHSCPLFSGILVVDVPLAFSSIAAGEAMTAEPWIRYNVSNGTALGDGTDTQYIILRDTRIQPMYWNGRMKEIMESEGRQKEFLPFLITRYIVR